MLEDTFGLTQINERSRFMLPSLPSQQSFSLQKSLSQNRLSDSSTPRVQKSSSTMLKVSDKLRDVQVDVKRSFDALYTTRRAQLLPKAMELERSDSVQDQMRTLENHVVALLKAYNELMNKRRSREALLETLRKELDRIANRDPDLTPAKTAAEDVKRRYEFALRQIDHETDYTEILDHMITDMQKNINKKAQPIYSLRRDLQQMKLRFHESEVDFLRVSLESRSLWNQIKRTEEEVRQQVEHHGHRMQEKVTHYRRRVEFVEFVQRQGDQKELEEQIRENERDTRRMEASKRLTERVEQMLESSKSHLEALQLYEKNSEVLSRAAHTGSIQQVIEYWQYLQDFRESLNARVEAGAERVEQLRTDVRFLTEERTSVRLDLSSDVTISPDELSDLRSLLDAKEKEVSKLMNKLRVWEQAVANIRGRLEGIWDKIAKEPAEMTLAELMRKVEDELVAKLPRRD